MLKKMFLVNAEAGRLCFNGLKVVKQYRSNHQWTVSKPAQLDVQYLCDVNNLTQIETSVAARKGVGDIRLIHQLKSKLDKLSPTDVSYKSLRQQLHDELLKIPNRTHPEVASYGDDPKVVKTIGEKKTFESEPIEFDTIAKRLNLVRTEQLGNLCGSRSYYLLGEMAELEHALTRYAVKLLLKNGFKLMTVPDILPRDIIESCGMQTKGERTQVYSLDSKIYGSDLCLSGTSEMALAGYLAGKTFKEEELPIRLAASSRCFRAEISHVAEERGIYRVHEFTKVEMFSVTTADHSEAELENIRQIQEAYFGSLGLHLRVLDMPPMELGAPAYRKYDIEAWLPGRKMYGELSSCSNCTDYQSRRLGVRYRDSTPGGEEIFVHTLNGTACAVPRLLIALVESGQNKNKAISLPQVLHEYMDGKGEIGRQKKVPELRLIKQHKK